MSASNEDAVADPHRRRLLAGIAAAPAIAAALSACGDSSGVEGSGGGASEQPQPPPGKTLPNPQDSGIDHIVVVMMENRSFDHMLGWVPGADGLQAGLRYPDKSGAMVDSFALADDPEYGFQGCNKEDPDHGYDGGRLHLNDGRMDGWLATVGDANVGTDKFPVGYYRREDLPFFAGVADHYTVCDRYFHGILASTFPNRFYLHAGETDRRSNSFNLSSLPTIWDRMDSVGATSRYYFHDLPVTALWGAKYLTRTTPFATFGLEASLGLLPNLSVVDPRFVGEAPNGITNDDHPQADVRNGQAFLNSVYEALRTSPKWDRTLMVVVYDEWGGFYDHVAPPKGPVSAAEAALPNDGQLGFRVPCVLLGPRAPRQVSSLQFDINSVLNMICWRFGAEPLGARGNWSLNLAYALDFDNPPRSDAPAFDVPAGPFGLECSTGLPNPIPQLPTALNTLNSAQIRQLQHNLEWAELGVLARKYGFPV